MTTRTLWKLTALSLTLSAPSFAADWRNDGNLRRKEVKSTEALEQAREDRGFALGLRAGYSLPLGSAVGSDRGEAPGMRDAYSGAIPLQVDVGYFFNSNVYLGAYFQYAPVFLAEDCGADVSCSANQLRFGVNASYHFRASEKLMPWLGLGIGYELLDTKLSASAGDLETVIGAGARGIEFASVQGGADYRVSDTFSIGPYLSLAAGVYQTATSRLETKNVPILGDISESASESIDDKAVHAWLSGGVRMQFRF
ncbi:outer membrane beta-barrel protein [Myxococcus sp. AM001]|uniref:outer membrane beta-barrel protein n=1 Tax=Myxococcus vastator TaxID=2709664 RepID=UPI0013D58B78|nr:outer membrane beta-barrel protein [Myxococcus vastator]NVJ09820.1 outer membrane beta-barrel protein [Myxococcus sp. AM001]